MKQFAILLITLNFFACSKAQTTDNIADNSIQNAPVMDHNYIKTHAATFTISNVGFEGPGKAVLEDMVHQSQFITLGEAHGSRQLSLFTKALLPLLHKADFQHFAIETGPHSAEKLMKMSTPANATVKNLNAFYTKYTVAAGGDAAIPVPFFEGIEDAEFLAEARKNDMDLWGLDQEFYFGAFFLMDELTQMAPSSKKAAIEALKGKAQQAMFPHFMAEAKGELEGAYNYVMKEPALQEFFAAFDKSNIKAQKMIEDLKISWDIYIRWRDDSHVDRISYMRNNFTKHYIKALQKENTPKVFTKIGSLHASKLLSNEAFDIGELTESIATKNGTVSTSINSWRPYSKENDSIINNLERYKKGYRRYQLITGFAKKDQWTIINLKAIRNAIEQGRVSLPNNGDFHKLKDLIYGYDYQLLLPVDEAQKPNRN